jgi:hypothetical protein
MKRAFEELAARWLVLAEQMEWMGPTWRAGRPIRKAPQGGAWSFGITSKHGQ